jgi:hypothetical protein
LGNVRQQYESSRIIIPFFPNPRAVEERHHPPDAMKARPRPGCSPAGREVFFAAKVEVIVEDVPVLGSKEQRIFAAQNAVKIPLKPS